MLETERSTDNKDFEAITMAVQISLVAQVGELRGRIEGLKGRIDDMHRLLTALITIAGGGLLTAVISLILQLLK